MITAVSFRSVSLKYHSNVYKHYVINETVLLEKVSRLREILKTYCHEVPQLECFVFARCY